MKSLKESILDNIDNTIKSTDDLLSGEADFKKIKKTISNKDNWTLKSNADYIGVWLDCEATFLCKTLGLDKETVMHISASKFKYHPSFTVKIIFLLGDEKVYANCKYVNVPCSSRTASGVIKTVKDLFKDFTTFKDYVAKNIQFAK